MKYPDRSLFHKLQICEDETPNNLIFVLNSVRKKEFMEDEKNLGISFRE